MHKHSERTDSRRKPKRPRLELERRRRKDDGRFLDHSEQTLFKSPMYLI